MIESPAFKQLCSFENLWLAWRRAAKRKRSSLSTAAFESRVSDEVLALQRELQDELYTPGPYRHFEIHEPKRRRISAAPFRDRVVHHALCQQTEPRFERVFIVDSYANRVGKGTHRAVDRFQQFARKHRYVLRMDIEQHFAAIDHAILSDILAKKIPEQDIFRLVQRILASGCGVLDTQYEMHWFPGDDLLAACRPRGLPIGNLTSQFWSNCYLHPLDLFVKRELGCRAYLRYVDDFALFHDRRDLLWRWKRAIVERLQRLRLTIHDNSAQVTPTAVGIPWLGFVIFPEQRRLKGRKLRYARRRLWQRYTAYCDGEVSFAEFDASVQGWINHVRYADSWRLREAVLSRMPLEPLWRRTRGTSE
jgi:hypothetical protein